MYPENINKLYKTKNESMSIRVVRKRNNKLIMKNLDCCWVLTAHLGEGVRRRGVNSIDTGSQAKAKQQTHLFSSRESLHTLLPAPRLPFYPLTLYGCSSLTRHLQDQYLLLSPQADFRFAQPWRPYLPTLNYSSSYTKQHVILLNIKCKDIKFLELNERYM